MTDVLNQVNIPEATYYYHVNRLNQEDPDAALKEDIQAIFDRHQGTYGYRRIHAHLRAEGWHVNHKKVQRLMRYLGLACTAFIRKSRYRSYKGTVGTVTKNRLNRRFNSSVPLQKLTTDITEFKCTADRKLYLNPILDLYNGEIIAYGISDRPTLNLVLSPLQETLAIVRNHARFRTTIHSDQGWHYQHRAWTSLLKTSHVFASMSRKATCADNAPMENFFGLLKQEMYYGKELVSYEELKQRLETYIHYYNHDRIKLKLAGQSPVTYRTSTSQLAVS